MTLELEGDKLDTKCVRVRPRISPRTSTGRVLLRCYPQRDISEQLTPPCTSVERDGTSRSCTRMRTAAHNDAEKGVHFSTSKPSTRGCSNHYEAKMASPFPLRSSTHNGALVDCFEGGRAMSLQAKPNKHTQRLHVQYASLQFGAARTFTPPTYNYIPLLQDTRD